MGAILINLNNPLSPSLSEFCTGWSGGKPLSLLQSHPERSEPHQVLITLTFSPMFDTLLPGHFSVQGQLPLTQVSYVFEVLFKNIYK